MTEWIVDGWWMDGRTNEWMDGQVDEQTDGWVGGHPRAARLLPSCQNLMSRPSSIIVPPRPSPHPGVLHGGHPFFAFTPLAQGLLPHLFLTWHRSMATHPRASGVLLASFSSPQELGCLSAARVLFSSPHPSPLGAGDSQAERQHSPLP